MPQSTLTDLAPLRRLAFFTLALAGAMAGAIALLRIGLPTQWAPIGIAWLVLCAALLAPLAVLERLNATAWPRDLLAGPGVIAALLVLWLIGYLGVIGLVVIALIALAALIAALRAELPGLKPGRLLGWLVVVIVLAIPLVGNLDGTKYANFIADRLMLFGRADGDTLFHGALVNALRYYSVTATGIDGVAPFSYHVGIHLLAARIAAMSDADAIPAFIAARAVLATPLVFFAIAAGGIVWARRRNATTDRAMLATIVSFVLTLGAGGLRIGMVGFDSESVILAGALSMLAFPSYMLMATGSGLRRADWIAGVLLVLPLGAAKISFGFVWGGVIGWWALRKLGLKHGGFWLIAVVDLAAFGLCLFLFNPGGAGAIWFGTPYYVEMIRGGNFLSPILINLIGFAVIALMVRAWRRPDSGAVSGLRARDVVETLAIVFVLANLPGTVMEIPGGDAFYFVVVFGWMALPLMTGEVLSRADHTSRPAARSVATVAVLACIVGLAIIGLRQWRMVINAEALVRSGDMQYFSGTSQKTLRIGASKALNELGVAGIFTASPAAAPAAPVVAALHEFRASAGNSGTVYVAPSTAGYWSLTEDCDGKSLFAMAAAGVPMLNGYYPDQQTCEQEFSLLGTPALPADLGKPLDDAAICAHAAAVHSTTVLIVSDPNPTTRLLACTGQ
jgi:hypothetical protein